MKGWLLSKDYIVLHRLIGEGYIIPAWIKYRIAFSEAGGNNFVSDIVQVYMDNGVHRIESRGFSYESYDFLADCKRFDIEFIVPNVK